MSSLAGTSAGKGSMMMPSVRICNGDEGDGRRVRDATLVVVVVVIMPRVSPL